MSMRKASPFRLQPTRTRPDGVYLMALETRFCTTRRSSRRVRAHHQRAGHVFQFDTLGGGERREFEFDLAHQFVDAEAAEFRAHGAGVEPRHVEQRAEDLLDRFERGVDVADQPAGRHRRRARSGW